MSTYDEMVAANPYRNAEYKKSWWQRVLSGLGFRTEADAWKENMQIQANEYDAQIAQMKFQNEYNSPSEQASRMRAAGQNPDLLGTGDVAGAASPFDDPSTPMQSTGQEGELMKFGQFCVSALTTGFALAKDFGSLASMHIANQAGRIENSEKVSKFADWIAHQLYMSPEQNESFAIDYATGNEERARTSYTRDLYDQYANQLPKRFRKQFERNLTTSMNSFDVRGEMYKKASEYVKNRKDWATIKAGPFYREGDDAALLDVIIPLANLSDQVAEAELKFKKNKADFDAALYDSEKGLNPETAASAQNTINLNEGQNASLNYQINKTMKEIIDNLRNRSNKGDILAQSMLFSFSLMRMSSFNLSPKGLSLGFNPSF